MEKFSRPDPVLFEDRYVLWPRLPSPPPPISTIKAFGDRWNLWHCKDTGGEWWWYDLEEYGHTDGAGGLSTANEAARDLAKRIETRRGLRCADCGSLFRNVTRSFPYDHDDCMPF